PPPPSGRPPRPFPPPPRRPRPLTRPAQSPRRPGTARLQRSGRSPAPVPHRRCNVPAGAPPAGYCSSPTLRPLSSPGAHDAATFRPEPRGRVLLVSNVPAALQPRCPTDAATFRPEPRRPGTARLQRSGRSPAPVPHRRCNVPAGAPPAGYCSSPTLRPEGSPAGHCLSPTLRPLSSPGRPEGLPTLAIPHGQAPLVRVCNGN
ncbi:uncharacterized protein B0H18DRAFT_874322, partial [Fomitopsis serialis]|uniref:uncharacterized protein n=1 Tax=Fomitopsis serialis TaxID=139415 RepID=UPI0020085DC5